MQIFPNHGSKDTRGKLGHPCLQLRAAARLKRTLPEVKCRLLWAADEGGLASAAGPPATFPPHRTLCLVDADIWQVVQASSHSPSLAQQESFPK